MSNIRKIARIRVSLDMLVEGIGFPHGTVILAYGSPSLCEFPPRSIDFQIESPGLDDHDCSYPLPEVCPSISVDNDGKTLTWNWYPMRNQFADANNMVQP